MELKLNIESKEEQVQKVTSQLSGLEVGQSFTLITDKNPRFLIEPLQEKCWGQFDWILTVKENSNWEGIITKISPLNHRDLVEFMTIDHKKCDDFYAEGEAALLKGDEENAKKLLLVYDFTMHRHFAMEENLFFPAFEAKTGMTQGPTQMMRMEHDQMRGALAQMREALNENDFETVFGIGETLLILLQQHNVKEEGILYPMADQHLAEEVDLLLKKMQLVGV
ncbi:MAG: hemerythrin-like domain-containing protein [bacterium]|jgi:hemerythrin-like domain-containing protein